MTLWRLHLFKRCTISAVCFDLLMTGVVWMSHFQINFKIRLFSLNYQYILAHRMFSSVYNFVMIIYNDWSIHTVTAGIILMLDCKTIRAKLKCWLRRQIVSILYTDWEKEKKLTFWCMSMGRKKIVIQSVSLLNRNFILHRCCWKDGPVYFIEKTIFSNSNNTW